jgi:hypothetical protein
LKHVVPRSVRPAGRSGGFLKVFVLLLGLAAIVGGSAVYAGEDSVRLAQNAPRGLAFDVFIRLQKGMSEGELLLRAGKPDSEVVENMHHDIVKTYYYLPTQSDPWITTIRLQGGRITDLDRVKQF